MATTTTTTIANTYQEFFSKELLKHQVQAVVLNQFAYQRPLDKNAGAKTISFFRRTASAVDASGLVPQVQSLTEGTPISTFRDNVYNKVSCTLNQYGEAAKITDIVTMTELFNALKDNISLMGEDAALHADVVTRNVLVAGATNKRYAQGAANYAALAAASASAGKATMLDFLDASTALRLRRATPFSGYFIAMVCPQVSRDLRNDADWIKIHQYDGQELIYKGEIGKWAGCRFVEHTNPFVENSAGPEGTYDSTGAASADIYRTFVVGQQAYGTPALAGTKVPRQNGENVTSPDDGEKRVKPEVIICDKPDKSDPLNQFMTAAWKSYWNALVLNPAFVESVSSKTAFV